MTESCSIRQNERRRAGRAPARETELAASIIELRERTDRLVTRIRNLLIRLEYDAAEAQTCLAEATKLVDEAERLVQAAGPREAEVVGELISSVAALKDSLAELSNIVRRPRTLGG